MTTTKIILINVAFIFIATLIPLIVGLTRCFLIHGGAKKISSKQDVLNIVNKDHWVLYWLEFRGLGIKLKKTIILYPISILFVIEEAIAKIISTQIIISVKKREK